MLSKNSIQPQASPLPQTGPVPSLDPNAPIEVTSGGSSPVNDPGATDHRPPSVKGSENLHLLG